MHQPLFQFVHASDPHWGRQDDPKFTLANERSDCFLADIRDLSPRPRFALMTGDLSSNGHSDLGELDLAMAKLDSLGIPVYTVPGNHDLAPGPGGPCNETTWYRKAGDGGFFWTAVEGPLELIGLGIRDGDPDGVLDRLEAHLAQSARGYRVLMSHYPVFPVREAGILARWGPGEIATCIPRLRELLGRHRDTVVAYLFGHVHVVSARVVDGILHASPGGLSVGAPGYNLVSVYAQGLGSRFVPVSDPALAAAGFWEETGPGAVDLYHLGLPVERGFAFDFGTRALNTRR